MSTLEPSSTHTVTAVDHDAETRRLTELVDAAVDASLADSTKRTYRSGWHNWIVWCARQEIPPMPVDSGALAAFLADSAAETRSGHWRWSVGTFDVWISAISYTATHHGYPDPAGDAVVRQTRSGIRRQRGTRPHRKAPLTVSQAMDLLEAMPWGTWPGGVAAMRDAALILCGIAGIGRRSELAGLNISDFTPADGGLHVLVRRSKTDQTGEGMVKFLPVGSNAVTCGPCAVWRWIDLVLQTDAYRERRSSLERPEAGPAATDDAGARAHRAEMMRRVLEVDPTTHVCHSAARDVSTHDVPLFRPITRSGVIASVWDDVPEGRTSRAKRAVEDRARLSGHGVNHIVQRRLGAIGLIGSQWGSHSLRAGFITEALRAGATTRQVARQTGQSDPTVAIYDREHRPDRDNAVTQIGL